MNEQQEKEALTLQVVFIDERLHELREMRQRAIKRLKQLNERLCHSEIEAHTKQKKNDKDSGLRGV